MKCPSCGYTNKDDALTCNLCHQVLARPKAQAQTMRVQPGQRPSPPTVAFDRLAPEQAAPSDGPKHLLRPVGAPPIELEVGKPFTVGRAPDSSLVLPSGRVSRNHAEIQWVDGKPVLSDKGSSNGTFVGGKPIKSHTLSPGEEVEIGPFFCTYVVEAAAAEEAPADQQLDATQTIGAVSGLLTGRIEANTLSELLQSIELHQKTGTLDFFGPAGHGWFAAKEGVPLAAEFGPRKGEVSCENEEAVLTMIGLTSGRFTFMPSIAVEERRIRPTITGLLLEAGRRRDEEQMANGTLETLDD